MKQTTTSYLTLGGLLLLLLLGSFVSVQLVRLRDEINSPRPSRSIPTMQTASTDVTNTNTGFNTTIVTTKLDSETLAEFQSRHLAACIEFRDAEE